MQLQLDRGLRWRIESDGDGEQQEAEGNFDSDCD